MRAANIARYTLCLALSVGCSADGNDDGGGGSSNHGGGSDKP